jgi:hypothetical protein
MNKKDVAGGFLGGLVGAAMLKQVYSHYSENDEQETRIFTELVLAPDTLTVDEIGRLEDFLRYLLNHDKNNFTVRYKQFRHFIVGGITGSPDSFQSTIVLLKRLLVKPTNDERADYCETYAIWKDTELSQINRCAKDYKEKAEKDLDEYKKRPLWKRLFLNY